MQKICTKCRENKTLDQFNKRSVAKNGLSSQCRECNKNNLKDHYSRNKKYYINKAAKQKKIRKIEWTNFKNKLKCERCEENHIATLDFHHLKPNEKDFAVSKFANMGYNMERILKEIEKCIVLCANCHRKEHYSPVV